MNTYTAEVKRTTDSSLRNTVPKNKRGVRTASPLVDNREGTIAQRKLQYTPNDTPQVQQPPIARSNLIVQAKRISIKQMQGMGFGGPYQGGTWQWNAPGGIHVTVQRIDGRATHFHVRKDTVGGVYNRIDYNEIDGVWTEGNVNVPAGAELAAEMKAIGQDTIRLINALVPPAD